MDLSRIENFQDAVVTVMGMGRYKQGSGLGATKWLIRHGAQVVITDLKDSLELKESVDLVMEWYRTYREQYPDRQIYQPIFVLGEHRKEDFTNVDCVVQNPGVPSEADYVVAAKELGIPIESDVSLFFRYYPHPIVAVTGTKGKTTTTLLVGEMLKSLDLAAITAGNIKASPLDSLDDLLMKPSPTPIVIEFSSWMLESMPGVFSDMNKGPDVAVLTNVYPEHLGRYASFEAYVDSKRILFAHQTPEQKTVLNYDHPDVRAMEPEVKGSLVWFAREPLSHDGCYVVNGMVTWRQGGKDTPIIALDDVALGEHALENILSSVAVSVLRGVQPAAIATVLKTFTGAGDRQELVREVDEIMYINDTAATNPEAAVVALNNFGSGQKKDVILLAGGAAHGVPFDRMADAAVEACRFVVLFPGEGSDALAAAINNRVTVERASSMHEAVQKARGEAKRGDIVLLSPGAAASGIFATEFDRGEQFREEVRNL
ncbi:MAG: UDP-N-acetylmuramoylalanine-D-glutamate ligase [Candidatus Uhrbacteria bacterium GW2011_GWD2_52_7]|uniref:UDP-N-acetylmuramoylalanine--D-glutamate ligase n=1 Tax=Candidatus Uhrbacteria bacterium GW2011_GWD2_52_7 TaxID=1618989 RepID=A0A0G1ZL60_9BACT|nr:MAG: UDP-N-acetylmuramoylalanine-D-glutamate ligase [Candidatus Uhrbacteria bacterium GW2011_GWD2_52_7]